MTKARVLVVDDEDTIRKLLKGRLEREGYDVVVANGADEAEKVLATGASGGVVGVMVTDLKMPGKDGFTLMAWAKDQQPSLRVVVITGHGEKEVAVQALRRGASDYLEKPFDLDELSHAVKRCLREHQLERENGDLVARLEARVQRVEGKTEDKYWYVSKAQSMAKVNEWLTILRREAMRGDAEEPTVLILGESGTGKEGIARMVHAGSRRGKGPWVAVNCANFNEQLLESELFGHEKGSFTGANAMKRGLFEIAKGGTLFLDEIGEMDVKLQAKLLRVLQEKQFRRVGGASDLETDVRVVAATNRNLEEMIKAGQFREDLFYRLNVLPIQLPPLRERKNDIEVLAKYFIDKFNQQHGKQIARLAPEAMELLRAHAWPGNIRELENVIEHAFVIESGNELTPDSLPESLKRGAGPGLTTLLSDEAGGEDEFDSADSPGTALSGPDGQDSPLEPSVLRAAGASLSRVASGFKLDINRLDFQANKEEFERQFLVSALRAFKGRINQTALHANIPKKTLLRKLQKYGISAKEYNE
jgi:DNA-binding NtrC family response regulator